MRVGILGPLEIERDGALVEIGGSRLRALIARLALDAGRPVSAGALADAVWDAGPPADEAHALQSLVSRLRGRLGDPALVAAAPGGGYRLAIAAAAIDAARFERLAADGGEALRRGDCAGAAELLGDALALWRGPALVDIPEHRFATAAAAALQERRLTALADRSEAELAIGRGGQLVGELEALVAANPLHERLAGQLIAAFCAAGRQADALTAYERVRARLADELGVPPSPALQAAHLAVLRGEAGPATPVAAPPLEPEPPRRRSNLAAAMTSFVGREHELQRIDELLAQSRLVTLVGPGGAGKTRLAREAVGGWVDRVSDGVWMVELAPITEPVEVIPAILGALGLRDAALLERRGKRTARDGLERLLDVLGDREAIVVLDNCEHLVAVVAELVEQLLGHCPRLRVLATSREPLAITGESLAPVPPLELPEIGATPAAAIAHPAVRLFADRAGAVRPGFAVDDATVAAVVEICRRLDGLPLAIELAAARLRSMPVQQVAERLDDRFRLLTGGSRTALPRHRTLRAVVDWSWELLDEPERRLARRLAVLGAGATVDSATAICADGDQTATDVLDGLAALVDRSLLQAVPATDPPRYRMLETIREYGLERLAEAGELEAVRAAHARWFAQLAIDAESFLRGPAQLEWFRRLDDERENVLAAVRWLGDTGDAAGTLRVVVALLWFWVLSGSRAEALAWVAFALAVPGQSDPTDRLVADGIHAFGVAMEDRDGSREAFGELMRSFSARLEGVPDDDRPLIALAKPVLALLSKETERIEQLVAVSLAHPDPWVRAATLLFMGARAENAGDADETRAKLAAAIDAYRAVGDRWGLSMALTLESGRRLSVGDLDGAEAAVVQARELIDALSPAAGGWVLDLRMCDVRLRRGDLAGAREQALRARDRGNIDSEDRVFAQTQLARVALVAGDVGEAERELHDAAQRLGDSARPLADHGHERATVQALIAATEIVRGDLAAAGRRLPEAYAIAVVTTDMPVLAGVGLVVATLTAELGDPLQAGEMLGASAVLRGGDDPSNPEIIALRGRLTTALGEEAMAAAYGRGRALTPEGAVARLEPIASHAAAVGP